MRYEPPNRTFSSVGLGCMGIIGILAIVVIALEVFCRVTMPECYDDTGAYDDSCSQGYLRDAEKEKTP